MSIARSTGAGIRCDVENRHDDTSASLTNCALTFAASARIGVIARTNGIYRGIRLWEATTVKHKTSQQLPTAIHYDISSDNNKGNRSTLCNDIYSLRIIGDSFIAANRSTPDELQRTEVRGMHLGWGDGGGLGGGGGGGGMGAAGGGRDLHTVHTCAHICTEDEWHL